ncbi:MAG: hypothetical protein DRJ35_04135 [Thermoprotei archaeon]|nr:MAG: hypothetical protein DRJ35_04135 [Thermoprotei archaeon]
MPGQEELINKIIEEISKEIAVMAPRIFFSLAILTISTLFVRYLHTYMLQLFEALDIDDWVEKLVGRKVSPPLSKILVFLMDAGIMLIGVLIVSHILLPEDLRHIFFESILMAGRLFSILLIAGVILSIFNFMMQRMNVETKLKSYLFFVSFLILTALLIDVSDLSPEVKTSLVSGLSTGIGLSIAVFATWFFFGDYLDRFVKIKETREEDGT